MEIFGAIPAGEHWRSSDLNWVYTSQEVDHHDHHDQFMSVDDHLTSDCDVPNYELNPIVVTNNSNPNLPFTIWPGSDSTIVHGMALFGNSCRSDDFSQASECHASYNYPHFAPLEFCEDQSTDMFLNNGEWLNINQGSIRGVGHGEKSGGIPSTAAHAVPCLAAPNQSAGENTSLSGNSKKRSRNTITHKDQGLKSKRSLKSRKINARLSSNDESEEDAKAGIVAGPISPNSPLSAGEHSQEGLGGTSPNSSRKGRTRAPRGSAIDPQSLYARKRREKINERLRVLQNLVPNGTKVDLSTMLEEAVQYVKFLQLQIKLLSSDELWMYAPLAYNGMDIGVDLRLISPRLI